MRILILGGYGAFGTRLAELLSDIGGLEIWIAGRDLAKARTLCARLGPGYNPLQLDRVDIAKALTDLNPELVVDASGPFQEYGDYAVVKACIAAGVNYLDFADGADFVFGISQFDAQARAAGIYALSGVSSLPALSSAVLRRMAETMEITSVEGGIAPSPFAGIGLNVMRAVVGYAGSPVTLTRHGQQTQAIGLAESHRFTIAPPGHLPLRNIRFSLVDVPDLRLLPPEHPALRDIWIGAGPVPEILHRALNLLAKTRHALRLPSLVPLSGVFHRVLNMLRIGEHRGGMFVRACGLREGHQVEQSWHLVAEGDDGPYIPSMAIAALIRKACAGHPPEIGARPATRALELADFEEMFLGRAIVTAMREPEPSAPLYRQILHTALETLPDQVQALHTRGGSWVGEAQVRRGSGVIASVIAGLVGFPKAAEAVPVRVAIRAEGGQERWTRDFGGQTFTSLQSAGTGRNTHLLVERFGIISVALALVVDQDRLCLVPRRWSCLGIPLPRALLPKGDTFETEANGKFRFNVEIQAPLIGLIVAYKGWLEPA